MEGATPTLKDLLERDKDKIDKLSNDKNSAKVDPEWSVIAEFGLYYGWEAAKDVRENRISYSDMEKLLQAARQIEAKNRYNRIIDMSYAFAGGKQLSKHLQEIKKGI